MCQNSETFEKFKEFKVETKKQLGRTLRNFKLIEMKNTFKESLSNTRWIIRLYSI